MVAETGKLTNPTVPREIITDPRVLSAQEADAYQLARGQFRVVFRVPEPEPETDQAARVSSLITALRDTTHYAQTEDGPKRLYVYAVSQRPGEPVDGVPTVEIAATFAVLDNPIWIVPALYALTAAIGTVGGWFLIDKVESFSGTTVGSLTILAAAALTGFVLYKTL